MKRRARTTTLVTTMALVAVAFAAMPAHAASACLGLVCTQVDASVSNPVSTQTQTTVQTCAGNIQVGVAGGNNYQCTQTSYQCGVNGQGQAHESCSGHNDE